MSRFTNTEKQYLQSVTTGDKFHNLVADVRKEINSRKFNNIQVIEAVITHDEEGYENDPIAIVTAKVLYILAYTSTKMEIHPDFARYINNKVAPDIPNIVCRVYRMKDDIEQENRIEKILAKIITEIIEEYNKKINFYNKKETKLAKELSKRKLEDLRAENNSINDSKNDNQTIKVLSKKQEKNLRRKERELAKKAEILKSKETQSNETQIKETQSKETQSKETQPLTEKICNIDWADDSISVETIPIKSETIPVETVPIKSETISVETEIVSTEPETVIAKSETIPIKHETVPTKSETVPTKPETVPTKPETVPTKPETVPVKPKKKLSYAQALRGDMEFTTIESNILCKKFEITEIFSGTDSEFVSHEKANFLVKSNTTSNPWLQNIMKKIHKPVGYKIRFYVNEAKYESIIMVKNPDQIILLQNRKHIGSNSQIKLDERWIRITLL